MRTFLASLLIALFSLNAMASEFRGGHPLVMRSLWNNEITIEHAEKIQNCIDATVEEAQELGADIDVETVIEECK